MAWQEGFAIKILKMKSSSSISSFLSGVLISASINILTGLLYLSTSDIKVSFLWCIVSSISLLGAGVLSIITSWKIDEIKEIAYRLVKPEAYENGDYWTDLMKKRGTVQEKAIKLTDYTLFVLTLMLIGFLTIIAWLIFNIYIQS